MNKHHAHNPMRTIGRIEQLILNRGFGFISTSDKGDLFFHCSQCEGDFDQLSKGAQVSFETLLNRRTNKFEALAVRVVKTDQDQKKLIAENCTILDHVKTELGVSMIETIKWHVQSFACEYISRLQSRYLQVLSMSWLRNKLGPYDHIRICIQMCEGDFCGKMAHEIFKEVAKELVHLSIFGPVKWTVVPISMVRCNDFILEFSQCLEQTGQYVLPQNLYLEMPESLLTHDGVLRHIPCTKLVRLLENQGSLRDNPILKRLANNKFDQVIAHYLKAGKVNEVIDLALNIETLDVLSNDTQLLILIMASEQYVAVIWPKIALEAKRVFISTHMYDGVLKAYSALIAADREVFLSLTPVQQVEFVWRNMLFDPQLDWNVMSDAAKVLAIYRLLKEGRSVLHLLSMADHFPLSVLSVLLNNSDNNNGFLTMHNHLQDYVVSAAWCSTDPLDLSPLLPHCPVLGKGFYCEGRPWPTDSDKAEKKAMASRAFCPRLRRECDLVSAARQGDNMVCKVVGESRIYPAPELPWEMWSLAEVLSVLNIKPQLPELRDHYEYITKISGWINRLNEIRARLKCSVCGNIMRPNLEYARYLARFNTTVVSCDKGQGHDHNVYLNHCWGCPAIIDNRESRIQIEGYHLCIHCGSGPKQSGSYAQGDVCPVCGKRRMRWLDRHGNYECTACGHRILIPPENRRTGARSATQEV